MPRLFISHSSKDNFEAIAFAEWLVREGWSDQDIFLDLHDIGAGQRWKEALAKANERCEAVVLLASPASLASTECRLEIRMAEDYGKEIIVAILYLLTPDADELGFYRERQIVDLGMEPRDATFTVEHKGQRKAVSFSGRTLRHIKARLDQLGISPTSFSWRPGNLETASPYPGFEGFSRQEAGLFFGRAGDIARGLAELRRLRRLGTGQVMVIQAASGAGKSSFLKAGLWPRLERDPDFLPLAILRSATGILTGENGLGRQLAAFFATHRHNRTATDIHEIVRRPPAAAAEGLVALLNEATEIGHAIQRVARPDAPVPTPVVAVDQAEELFAGADSEESLRFLALVAELLAPARQEGEGQARLKAPPLFVWTIRADSLDELLQATDGTGIKAPQPLLLPPIPREAYREIIEAPLAVANQAGMRMAIDPLLVDALVEASTGADALPLLAFTLRQLLADNRSGATANLTLAQFKAAGGMEGILGKRLAGVQRAVGSSPEGLRRLLLPNLATWDEEAKPPAARRLVAHETQLLGGARAGLKPLADALVEARLLTRSGSEGGEPTLEVAHEALLRQPPISDWLAEDREFLVWRERLSRTRAQFDANARGLLVGRELQIARGWLGTRAADVAEADRAFIAASAAEDDRRRGEEEERERRQQAEKLAASQRLVRRTVAGLAAALVLAVIAGLAGFYAHSRQQLAEAAKNMAVAATHKAEAATDIALKARNEALLTQSKFLTSLADEAMKQSNPATAALLALEALPDAAGTTDVVRARPYWSRAEEKLVAALRMMRETRVIDGHDSSVRSIALSEDGTILASTSADGTARVWDVRSGAELHRHLSVHAYTPQRTVSITRDGKRVMLIERDSHKSSYTLIILEPTSGRAVRLIQNLSDAPGDIALSADGALAVAIVAGVVRRWNGETGQELPPVASEAKDISCATLSGDGKFIAIGASDGKVRVVDAATNTVISGFSGASAARAIATSFDGTVVLTGFESGAVLAWSTEIKKQVELPTHKSRVTSVALSHDGKLATTSAVNEGAARIWDLETRSERGRLVGHDALVWSVTMSGDGSIVASAGGDDVAVRHPHENDKTIRIWQGGTRPTARAIVSGGKSVSDVAFSPDATAIYGGTDDGVLSAWNLGDGRLLWRQSGHSKNITKLDVSDDGGRILSASGDNKVRIWDARTGAPLLTLDVGSAVRSAKLFPDGKRIAIALGSRVEVWSIAGSTPTRTMAWKGVVFESSLSIMPDGRWLAFGNTKGQVYILDVATGRVVREWKAHRHTIFSTAVTPDGKQLVTGTQDDALKLWSTDGSLVRTFSHVLDTGETIALVDDGRILLVASQHAYKTTSDAYVYDFATGERINALPGQFGRTTGVAGHRGHTKIATIVGDTIRVWPVFPRGQALVDLAKAKTPRCLSVEERAKFHLGPQAPDWCQAMGKYPFNSEKRIATLTFEADLLLQDGSVDAAIDAYSSLIAQEVKQQYMAKRLRDAYFGRGRAYEQNKNYAAAAADFRIAGHWWESDRLASQMLDEGKLVPALLVTALNGLDLTPELKGKMGRRDLKSTITTLRTIIGELHADIQKRGTSLPGHGCDRVAHPHDPRRTTAGVPFDKIDKENAQAAVAACELALKSHPNELRYLFQRARALSRLARLEEAAGDKAKASELDAAAIDGLKAAADGGYPVALNNLALAYWRGEGVAKDEDKAADLDLEAFNGTVHCCWVPVARHLLEREGEHDQAQVRRVVHELLLWARALGSEPAGQMLAELYAKGTLAPPTDPPAEEKATFAALPPWLR